MSAHILHIFEEEREVYFRGENKAGLSSTHTHSSYHLASETTFHSEHTKMNIVQCDLVCMCVFYSTNKLLHSEISQLAASSNMHFSALNKELPNPRHSYSRHRACAPAPPPAPLFKNFFFSVITYIFCHFIVS